jgi:ectoine hydroxylase-related dioxygenase (phytanoyl-CoA dioxygenase family)
MLKKLDNEKIISEIKENGYSILENFFDTQDLDFIKKSFLQSLNYIHQSKETDLKKKYYEIKKFNPKLKSHFYDLMPRNINMLKLIHSDPIVSLIKEFFNTEVLFSGRPAIHVHDKENDKLLDAHQETNQIARDIILFWCSLWDTNEQNGGLTIYPGSHKNGYLEHSLEHPTLKEKAWTKNYTHISEEKLKQYKKINLNVKAGSVVLVHSALVHSGYPLKDKEQVRIVITERFNPLDKIPFLKNEDASLKIPYVGIDYNKITE